ncbi:MAG: 30S ribosome-binding factor RbfA [Clostridia bacterium]|nr:30S ribosome-binding factor RbfA [Clostridia bacterium]
MKVNRGDRLASSFKKVIYEIITQKLKNPFITEMVSIIKIDVSKDMSHAKVYLSVYSKNEERKQRTFDEIVKSTKTIRYELARMVQMRIVPELHFFMDDSMDYGDKMEKLFLKINETKSVYSDGDEEL